MYIYIYTYTTGLALNRLVWRPTVWASIIVHFSFFLFFFFSFFFFSSFVLHDLSCGVCERGGVVCEETGPEQQRVCLCGVFVWCVCVCGEGEVGLPSDRRQTNRSRGSSGFIYCTPYTTS